MPARQELDVITRGAYSSGQQAQGRVITLDADQTAVVVQVYRSGFAALTTDEVMHVYMQIIGQPKQYHLMTIRGGEHQHRLGFIAPFSTARFFLKPENGPARKLRIITEFMQNCPGRIDVNLLTLSRAGIKAIEQARLR